MFVFFMSRFENGLGEKEETNAGETQTKKRSFVAK